MKKALQKLTSLRLLLAITMMVGAFSGVWADEVTYDFSTGGVHGNETNTWTTDHFTIVQGNGGSATAVADYLTAPRWYKYHTVTFTPAENVTITQIVINCSVANYNGQTITASDNTTLSVNGNNSTWSGTTTKSAPLTLTMGKQCRPSSVVVTYTVNGGSSTLTDCDLALTGTTDLTFDLYNNTTAQVINYTTSSTGAVTVEDNEYVDAVVDATAKTITVTPKKKTSGAQEITVNQASDNNYKAGTATFSVTIDNSAPVGNVTDETITISNLGYANGAEMTQIDGTAVTITWDKGTNTNTPKAYNNGTEVRFYKGNTMTFTASKNIIQIDFTYSSGYNGNNFTASTGTMSSGTWTGSATEVTLTNGASDNTQIRFTEIIITYEGGTAAIPAPVFSPASGATFGNEGLDVALAQTNNNDIYYTLDGTDPTLASTKYTDPIHLTATTTVKAVAHDGTTYSKIETATYTYVDPDAPGTAAKPYTVAQARAAIDANSGITGVYATGIVSEIVTAYNSQYGNITYNISADGTTTADQLQAYRGKGINGDAFTSEDDIQVGDVVVIYGNLKKHNNTTYEFDSGNQLVSLTRPVAVPKPTFSPEEGIYYGAQQVTLSVTAANTLIYYTTDGTEPTNQSTRYTAPFTIDATTTIKAVAYDQTAGTYSAVASATYTIRATDAKGSATNPYTVAEALTAEPIEKVYVKGIVSQVESPYDTDGYATYYISDDGTTTGQFQIYRGWNLNQNGFYSGDHLYVGDEVVVYGNIILYSGTNELDRGNYLYSLKRAPTISLYGGVTQETFPAKYPDGSNNSWGSGYTITVNNYTGTEAVQLTYCDASGTPVTDNPYDAWFHAYISGGGNTVSLSMDAENTNTDARYAYLKLYIADGGKTYYSDLITVTQEGYVDLTNYTRYNIATAITSGKHYIIVGTANGVYKAMGAQTNNNRAAVDVTKVENGIATVANDAGAHEFIICGPTAAGLYTIYDADATDTGYLYAASSSANHLKTETATDKNGVWNITFDTSTGIATIVAEKSSNRNVMQYNSGSRLFSCYASASQKPVYLYEKDGDNAVAADYTRTATVGNYGTICLPNNATIAGAELYSIAGVDDKDAPKALNLTEVYVAQAGVPYIFKATASTINAYYTGDAATAAGSANGLIGSFRKENITDDAGQPITANENPYVLKNNKVCKAGTNVSVGLYKAYIDLNAVPVSTSSNPVKMFIDTDADGIDAMDNGQTMDNAEFYDLAGRRVIQPRRGIYIVNGKKVLVK